MSVRKREWTTRRGEERAAWVLDYRDREGTRRIETFDKKKLADARAAEVAVDIKDGVHVPRDEDGRRVMVDWSGGPPPPAPDANFEPPSDADAEGRAIVAEVNGEAGSFDELDSNSQTLFRDQAGYDQAVSSVDKVRAHFGDAFGEVDAAFEELPGDAQMVVAALLSHDWTQHGAEALADALDQLSDTLPLTSEAALREFLEDNGFIEG